MLWSAGTGDDSPLVEIDDGDVFDYSAVNQKNMLTLVAEFAGPAPHKVIFEWPRNRDHIEREVPYAMIGNIGDDFLPSYYLADGGTKVVTVKATNRDGVVLDEKTITFTLEGSPMPSSAPTSTPVPSAALSSPQEGYVIEQILRGGAVNRQDTFDAAKAKWTSVISSHTIQGPFFFNSGDFIFGQCGAVPIPPVVQDLVICATFERIDGPRNILGFAGPIWIFYTPGTTSRKGTVGVMVFDIEDVEGSFGENLDTIIASVAFCPHVSLLSFCIYHRIG